MKILVNRWLIKVFKKFKKFLILFNALELKCATLQLKI